MKFLKPFLRPLQFIVLLLVIVLVYAFSVSVTQPDFGKLVSSWDKGGAILDQLLRPEIFIQEIAPVKVSTVLPIPCGSAPNVEVTTSGPRIIVEPACADVKQVVTVKGYELGKIQNIILQWKLPNGKYYKFPAANEVQTDENGYFEIQIETRPIIATQDGVPIIVEADIQVETGRLIPSSTLINVANNIMVTIFMALIATSFGTILALPLSFLGASNITRKGILGSLIYYISRSVMNLLRSFEPLVIAMIFAFMTSFGSPFAGVIALTVVTTASLGKMFSESVESIDNGPIEAITATGANRLQVVIYGVVPQIIPDFLSFFLYHWDINVRISTIIGFVGGGGIGYYLQELLKTFSYSKAGTALLAIIIVVMILDFLSAQARKRLV
jgi:phosphonate transport system permease protein